MKNFAAARSAAKIIFHFLSSASRGTAWPLHFKFASYAYAEQGIVQINNHISQSYMDMHCWNLIAQLLLSPKEQIKLSYKSQ